MPVEGNSAVVLLSRQVHTDPSNKACRQSEIREEVHAVALEDGAWPHRNPLTTALALVIMEWCCYAAVIDTINTALYQ